jgi:hypothetical protein
VRNVVFRRFVRAIVVVGIGWAAPASADSASGAIVQTSEEHFLCYAGDGQFIDGEVGRWKESWSLSGRVRFLDDNGTSDWPSAGAIVFELEDGGNTGAFLQSNSKRDGLDVVIKLPGVGRNELLSEVPRDSWVNLAVSIDQVGNLTVSDGEHVRTIALESPKVVRRQIHCQSGAFQFDLTPAARPIPQGSNQQGQSPAG